jgi:hypothetical protein
MPGLIRVSEFVEETREDYNSPTTSTFVSRMPQCRQTIASLEEVIEVHQWLFLFKEGLRFLHVDVVWTIFVYIYVDCSCVKMLLWRERSCLHFSCTYVVFILISTERNGIAPYISQFPCKHLVFGRTRTSLCQTRH